MAFLAGRKIITAKRPLSVMTGNTTLGAGRRVML
jgi:hypothetical protein